MKNCISSLSTLSLILICVVFLNSCGTLMSLVFGNMKTDQEITQEQLGKVLDAIENEDSNALKALFAKSALNKLENFDASIEQLFDYYEGIHKPVEEQYNTVRSQSQNYGMYQTYYETSYAVSTNITTYRIAFLYYFVDDYDSDNIGIHSLYIIKEADYPEPEYTYRGDGKNTHGINIGVY